MSTPMRCGKLEITVKRDTTEIEILILNSGVDFCAATRLRKRSFLGNNGTFASAERNCDVSAFILRTVNGRKKNIYILL